jgi:hypothetical protein
MTTSHPPVRDTSLLIAGVTDVGPTSTLRQLAVGLLVDWLAVIAPINENTRVDASVHMLLHHGDTVEIPDESRAFSALILLRETSGWQSPVAWVVRDELDDRLRRYGARHRDASDS